MRGSNWLAAAAAIAIALGGCAGPPLTLYTLEVAVPEPAAAPVPSAFTVQIASAAVPDELDNEDILIRSGATLHRSTLGRRGTRLSTQVTERLTQRLAAAWPRADVTNAPPLETPDFRLVITLNRFDITTNGTASLAADWLIIPGNPATQIRHNRDDFTITGPVATDLDVVRLQGRALDQLAAAIALTNPELTRERLLAPPPRAD